MIKFISLFYFCLRLTLKILLFLYLPPLQAASEQVSIQLKWKHDFQFAGYYAAIEKGYYREEGLEVTLKAVDLSKDNVEQVIAGESEYGISDSSLLAYHLNDVPVLLVNQIFQHSPLVFLSHRDSGIISPYEMTGKTVATTVRNQGDVPLNTLLLSALGDLSKIRMVPFTPTHLQDFIEAKVDVIPAYSTSQPYELKQLGVEVNIIDPQTYGIDYYGDNLFTSHKELHEHPERVKKISQASLKGWKYALDHPDEMIELIRKKYAPALSEGYLRYQARTINQIIIPELIELGSVEQKRYQQIAEDYYRLGFAQSSKVKDHFFYQSRQKTTLVKLTAGEKSWISRHPHVMVGAESDWPPFDFVDKNGQHSGVANDYLELVAEKTGLMFHINSGLWSDNLQKIKNKQVDLLSAAYFTEERSQFVNYSSAYFEVLDYFFIRDGIKAKTLDDLGGKRIAIPKDYVFNDLIKKHFPKIKIVTVKNMSEAIEAVLENRADILFDAYASLAYALKKEGISSIIPFKSARELGTNSIHFITRKNAPELASIIQKGLAAITMEERNTIYKKWLGSEIEKRATLTVTREEEIWLQNHPDIRLGVSSNWPPYEFVDSSGKFRGFAADVLKLLEQRLGIKFNIISQYPWGETLEKTKNQQIDMLSSIAQTANRATFLKFTEPFFTPLISIYTRNNTKDVKTVGDLKNKTVAIENQYFLHERLVREFPEIKLLPVETTADALKTLSYGKADAYIGNQGAANWIAEQNALTNLRVTHADDLQEVPLRFAVRKDWAIFQGLLNKALADISEMEMSTIRRKWMGVDAINTIKLSLSATEKQWLERHKIIRFTGDPNWLPYEAFDKQGIYIGIVAEHLKLIEQKLGIKVEIIPTKTWGESIAKVKQGEIDVLSETSDSNLKSHLQFTQDYLSSPVVIVMRNDEDYVENIEQIQQRKIAVIKDYGYIPEITKKYPNLGLHDVASIQEGLIAVSTGKVDALIATLAQASYHISELGVSNIHIAGKTEFKTKLAFGMRKEFAPLVPLFNRALGAISADKKQRIIERWGKYKFAAKTDYGLIAKVAAGLLFVIAFFVYWNYRLAKEIGLRKKMGLALKEEKDNFQALFEKVSDGNSIIQNGVFIGCNEALLKILGLQNKNQLLQTSPAKWSPEYQPDGQLSTEKAEEMTAVCIEKGTNYFEWVHIYSDNTEFWCDIVLSKISHAGHDAIHVATRDITEKKQIAIKLEQAKKQAESANRAKSDFLSNMSHEIRTPMNAIIGFTELLNEQIEDPKLKSFAKTIQSAGNNLLTLINDILDLSKIEAGKFEIEKAPTNPHVLFEELGNIFIMKMRDKNLDFILEIDPVIPQNLQLDAPRLRQVLLNLIGNAVKFTDKGYVKLIAYTGNEDSIRSKLDLLIDIEDTGIGIAEDQQQIIFPEFEQTSGQDVRKYGGTGLGLSISKRLIALMGGELTLKSQLEKGSTFTLKLSDVAIASVQAETEQKAAEVKAKMHFQPANILIVDDIEDNSNLLLAIFAKTKLKAMTAINGLEAVNMAKQQPFDLILMDIRMPVMGGYQAAEEIKAFSKVPIIALTASVMTSDFERLKGENFDGYLRKPVLKTDLFSELSKFLPFEQKVVTEETAQAKPLTDSERECLPVALEALEKLTEQCSRAAKSNSIPEISAFSDMLTKIARQNPIAMVTDYAEQLNNEINSFDIAAIKRSLNNYPQLIDLLRQ